MDELFASIQQDLAGLADRLAAVEARLAQVGVPASAFSGILAKAGGRPAFPARSVADVLADHAPQAPQGVTVEELVDCLPNLWTGNHDDFARYLLNHPRLGPLLRGEGAPAPDPVDLYRQGRRDAWAAAARTMAAARAEVARQQGGQADG